MRSMGISTESLESMEVKCSEIGELPYRNPIHKRLSKMN